MNNIHTIKFFFFFHSVLYVLMQQYILINDSELSSNVLLEFLMLTISTLYRMLTGLLKITTEPR